MKEYLQDIVSHTQSLTGIETLKIIGDANSTNISTIAADQSIVLDAVTKDPIPGFIGTFGMPNLDKLKTILSISEYAEDAKCETVIHNNTPIGLHFENKGGDFKNDYRFMSADAVNTKVKTVKMRAVTWDVDFNPTVENIIRLKYQAVANAEETVFNVKTDNGNLKFYFGDHSSHSGNFVFHPNVKGTLNKVWAWPVGSVMSILNLLGDKNIKISNEGVLQITVDSEVAVYTYKLPAHQK